MKRMLLIATLVLAGLGSTSWGQVQEVTLRIDGLACPFCAYGVEKKLKRVGGVQSMDVRINEGKVILQWRPNQSLNLKAIDKAVDQAGFTLKGVKTALTGHLRQEDGRIYIELPAPISQRFDLSDPSGSGTGGEGATVALTEAMKTRLQAALASGDLVRVLGTVYAREGPDLLGIDDFSVVPGLSSGQNP